MTEIKCCICQKDIEHVGVLFRINAKGVPGIWACDRHLSQTDAPPVDEELHDVVNVISGRHSSDGVS